MPYSPLVDRIIELALQEDLGTGDLATNALITSSTRGEATLVAKSNGIVSGLGVAARVFWVLDSSIMLVRCLNDGDPVVQGMEIARIRGSYRSLLSGERTALNFLQRMCGIATLTRQYVSKLEGYKTRLLDTRKTAPGLRILDKLAVLHGGGSNHRMGLYDLAMIKDTPVWRWKQRISIWSRRLSRHKLTSSCSIICRLILWRKPLNLLLDALLPRPLGM